MRETASCQHVIPHSAQRTIETRKKEEKLFFDFFLKGRFLDQVATLEGGYMFQFIFKSISKDKFMGFAFILLCLRNLNMARCQSV